MLFWVQRRGSAAHFLEEYLEGLFDYAIVVENRGEMLPVFLREFISSFDFPNCGKCCPFFWENFSSFRFSKLRVQRGGNAAHFSGRIFLLFDSRFWVQIRGKFCPFFWVYFSSPPWSLSFWDVAHSSVKLFSCFDYQNFVFKEGGNAAHLSGRAFCFDSPDWPGGNAVHALWVLLRFKQGQMLPFFSESLGCFDCRSCCVCSKNGEMLPIFLGELFLLRFSQLWVQREILSIFLGEFFQPFWSLSFFWGSSKGRCCPFFCENFELFRLSTFCVQRRGKCCPFFWEGLLILILQIVGSDQGEMLSIFWENFFSLSISQFFWRFKQGQMLPFFSESLSCFDYQSFCVQRRGKMLPIFLGEFFIFPIPNCGLRSDHFSVRIFLLVDKEQMLPILQWQIWAVSIIKILCSEKGEMLPIFLGEFFQLFDSKLWVQIRGNSVFFSGRFFSSFWSLSFFRFKPGQMLLILQ